ncbi:hypothetical protein D3C73_130000 [compost metagenome]|jgi:hypothetical protein
MVLIPAFLGIRLESGGLLGHHQPHYWPALANRLQERDPMSKLTDNLDANFQLFIEEVRESGQVWGLRYGEDWVVCRSAEFEDADVMPLWSAEGDARLHCVDEWADYEPEVIELEEFLDIWINDLDEDDVLVGPNWNADLEGQELEPIELAKALVELDA